MGVGVFVIVTSIALAAAAAAYAILSKPEGNQDGMEPKTLDDFGITQCKEGLGIPLGYGDFRLPGNIIWYGNLVTEEITQKPKGGGKGSGGQEKQVTGYKYYLDVWQGICFGKAIIQKILTQDKEVDIEGTQTYNDGTQSTFPTFTPFTASPLNPVCHLAIEKWLTGENSTSVPTLHFVMRRVLEYTEFGANQNLSNGSNAAVVIYDILIQSGVKPEEINLASFQNAVDYYDTKGYGLNFVIKSPTELGKVIESVINDIDAVFYKDNEGLYTIRPLDINDSSQMSFTKEDMVDFSFNRKTWLQVPNFFTGTYLDEDDDFAQRTIRALNPAAIRLAGIKQPQNVNLKRFRDRTTATYRLFELMKRNSYPGVSITFKTSLKGGTLLPGDVITISHEDYGIVSADFRINDINAAEVDKIELTINAYQMVETLFDDEFVEITGSDWVEPDITPCSTNKNKNL